MTLVYRLYYPLCISHIIYTWQIVYLSNKDPCPKIAIHKSEIKVPWTAMEIHKFQHLKWLALAEPWNCPCVPVGHECTEMYLNLTFINLYLRTGILIR